MVVQALDKNNNQLWVECSVLTWERVQKEIIKAPSFLYVNVDRKEVLHAYRTNFEKHNSDSVLFALVKLQSTQLLYYLETKILPTKLD
eukprot:g51357.t1